MGPYLALLRRHPAVLAFGFLCGLSSSVGQTFFVSLFVPSVTASFDLDAAGFSSLYALVTVASAITLPFIGPKIDDTDLKRYAALALGALGLACFGMALAPGLLVLVVALYGVRMLGQGLMSHIEVTSTSRYFQRSRGKALALVMLGHPAGEGALPALFTLAIAAWGWRTSWAVAGGVLVAGVLPLVLGLLRGKDTAPLAFVAPDDAREPRPAAAWPAAAPAGAGPERVGAGVSAGAPDVTRAELVRLPGASLLLPYWLAPAFVLTAFLFHQLALADELGWSHTFVAGSFVAFAVGRSVVSLLAGPLIDRVGASRLVPWLLLPLACALLPLVVAESRWWAVWYLGLSGITIGLTGSVRSAWLAETMGTAHLGAIRSMLFPLGVLSTAGAAPALGYAVSAGLTLRQLAGATGLFVLLCTGLAWIGFRLVEAALVKRTGAADVPPGPGPGP